MRKKKGHNYQIAQRCCIVIDRKLICACCASLALTQGGMSCNFKPCCYTEVPLCFCSLPAVRLQCYILNHSLSIWLAVIFEVTYHECISRTSNSKSTGLSIMLVHSYGEKPAYSVLSPACISGTVVTRTLTWVVWALHSTGSYYVLQEGLQLAVETAFNFQTYSAVNTSSDFCHMASGAQFLTADSNSKNNNTAAPPPPQS